MDLKRNVAEIFCRYKKVLFDQKIYFILKLSLKIINRIHRVLDIICRRGITVLQGIGFRQFVDAWCENCLS